MRGCCHGTQFACQALKASGFHSHGGRTPKTGAGHAGHCRQHVLHQADRDSNMSIAVSSYQSLCTRIFARQSPQQRYQHHVFSTTTTSEHLFHQAKWANFKCRSTHLLRHSSGQRAKSSPASMGSTVAPACRCPHHALLRPCQTGPRSQVVYPALQPGRLAHHSFNLHQNNNASPIYQ